MVLLGGALSVLSMIKSSTAYTASSTIYIYSNGTVYPAGAPISVSGNIYTFTDNVVSGQTSAVIIQRSNTILDGGGHSLTGQMVGNSNGVYLSGLSNVTIRNMSIKSFFYGIYEGGCSNGSVLEATLSGNSYGVYVSGGQYDVLSGNNITSNTWAGVYLYYSYYNNVSANSANFMSSNYGGLVLYCSNYNYIVGNNLTSNDYGVYGYDCELNYIFHNNFVSNVLNAYVMWDMGTSPPGNYWDNGYPSGGNYWSDYQSKYPGASEINSSGIWNTPYTIDSADVDYYPLMEPWAPPAEPPVDEPADVHLLLTVNPGQSTYVGNQSLTLDVSVLDQSNASLNSTLTLTVTGPGGYYYFDFQTVNVTATAVADYRFTWNVPNVAGTYYAEVGLVPPQLTAYDAVWLSVV
jgi:parallel beta-helix repeat protein